MAGKPGRSGGHRPRKYFPISAAAIAAAAAFIRQGRRKYTYAGEPAHPSLRQVIAHLVGRGLVEEKKPPPPATLARALKRAGVVLGPHWRNKLAPGPTCAAVSKVGESPQPAPRRSRRARPDHAWRRRRRRCGPNSFDVNISPGDRSKDARP